MMLPKLTVSRVRL